MRCLEFERVDVLIFFWRILRILNAAVGPMPKPLWMLHYVRMIRRTLISNIQSNVDFLLLRRLHQTAKVFQSAKLRMDRFVPTLFATDRPRTSWLAGFYFRGVVAAFSKRCSDRMNGREVDNIESHL